ncbi:MAG: metallophosphoesterase family protein [Breznakibacter sp.]
MIRILLVLLISFVSLGLQAQRHELRFKADRKFKIVQFTDLHIAYQDKRSEAAFECIKNVVEAERPDLIMLTGDIIYSQPADANFRQVMEYVSSFGIPFALTFGNHDHEQGLSDAELLKIGQSVPHCMVSDEKGLTGDGNYVLTVHASGGNQMASVLYCLDSNSYSQLKERGVEGYDYIHRDQINWYAETSQAFTRKNNGQPLPALAFFHIPLVEHAQAAMDPNAQLYGIRREMVCSSMLNSGMFAAIKEQGDVMGVFVGHDHDNDFAVGWNGVLLAYGRFSGGNTEYNHIPNGARVIELTEGERTFRTWIRQRDNQVVQSTTFPADYVK